jgi:hypothetical protein
MPGPDRRDEHANEFFKNPQHERTKLFLSQILHLRRRFGFLLDAGIEADSAGGALHRLRLGWQAPSISETPTWSELKPGPVMRH